MDKIQQFGGDQEVKDCALNGFRFQVALAIRELENESDYIKRIFAREIRETEIKKLENELKFEYEKYLENWQKEHDEIDSLEGLHDMGTERHE